jgi:aminoglycoside/choline kinase family phosphotransferase
MESSGTSPKLDMRIINAQDWLSDRFTDVSMDFTPVAGDASHRRYFRVLVNKESRILMDAPPAIENCESFLDIGKRLRQTGLHAPEIIETDIESGFILMEDLGDRLYRDVLDADDPKPLFNEAFTALQKMAQEVDSVGLPVYKEDRYFDEMNLFTDHYLIRHLDYRITHKQRQEWMNFSEELVTAALEQPQTFVHKDFHSCNLLETTDNSPGIIDFQDALLGPVTHDFVSLIWDRYVAWPRPLLEQWMEQFRQMVAPQIPSVKWIYYCDLVGLQRNLRIVGRFAQLKYSEGKPGYVAMIPRFHQYILDVLPLYPQFSGVAKWIGSDECAP